MTLRIWPTRSQFTSGEPVRLRVEATGLDPQARGLRVRVLPGASGRSERLDLDHGAIDSRHPVELDMHGSGSWEVVLDLGDVCTSARGSVGFAVVATVELSDGREERATTALDVGDHWTSAPRYGFFADFTSTESVEESTARADDLLRLHVNVVQFYDWMASHHTLVPTEPEFVDPLGRHLSRTVVERKIALAHERGMAAIAYGALYGAEADFAEEHPDWLLYDGQRRPLVLADIFYLQDIREGSGWRRWILDQYRNALATMGFDGIHIDQYGYPKRSLSRATGRWEEVELGAHFAGFVEQACSEGLTERPEGGSIFNLVNAWPLEQMVHVQSDAATYIEVWEPHATYRDLCDLVSRARALRPDKHVILAAYLRPFHPVDGRSAGAMNTFRLASAAISASGGFHLIAGEGTALLTEAYYPSYGRLEPDDAEILRRYCDFAVRHTAALHAGGPDVAWTYVGPTNDVVLIAHPELPTGDDVGYCAGAVPGTIWVTARDFGAVTVLNLVNLVGVDSGTWNADLPSPPHTFEAIEIRVVVTQDVAGVWWDTPDDLVGTPRTLDYRVVDTERNRFLVFTLPRLEFWSLVWWRLA